MDESTLLFRSSRGSSSSFSRPAHRSRSLGTLSTLHKHTDPAHHMSKIRDHDLKTNIEAKVVHIYKSNLSYVLIYTSAMADTNAVLHTALDLSLL